MPVASGTRLGPYEIVSPLGAGGMGEVYKARDTRLDRIVAIKILPDALASDPQFRERFDREARTISQLDHPNICTLFDIGAQDGVAFLVMQFLDGETLDARLKARAPRGLPIDEALRTAIEVADALDRAHRAAIVHRDLKPANIFLARSASAPPIAKLLDFGLAKLNTPAVSPAGGSMLPTAAANITAQGTILGTFQYMAPEQLEGVDADARTDIFAFGAVVYEMVTGRKAFEGKSQVSLIGAILEREPTPISTLAPTAPAGLDRIIKRCLAKDPDRRWQTASDLAHELRWVAESAAVPESAHSQPATAAAVGRSSASMWKVATAAGVLLAAATAWAAYVGRSTTREVARFFVNPPEKMSFVSGGRIGASGIISPDGHRLVFSVRDRSQISLWLRSIDTLAAQPLAGTDEASFPFWSPDSRSIGYFAKNKLMKIDANGGPPQTLCDAPGARGGAWNRNGTIVFGGGNGPLNRISSIGGQPSQATKLLPGEADHRFPTFLPDGRHFLFFANYFGSTVVERAGVYLGSLDSTDVRPIIAADSGAIYAAGHLLFVRRSTLLAQPFSLSTLDTAGDSFPVAERVTRNFGGIIAFSVSDSGALAYGLGPTQSASEAMAQLTWVDRQGKSIETVGVPGTYRGLDLSPDDKRIAVHRHDGAGGDIWIFDGARSERFTFDPAAENESPLWSPDGQWIAFAARRGQKVGLFRKLANNTGSEELLSDVDVVVPESWSSDSQQLVYRTGRGSATDLYTLSLTGARKPFPAVTTPAIEVHAQVSPDGRWLAFQEAENPGSRPEIYVRPSSGGGAKYQVSSNGGSYPRWRANGRELFYLESSAAGPGSAFGKVMSVEIGPTQASFDHGAPRPLFDSQYTPYQHPPGATYHAYAVSRDGQRFLIPRPQAAVVDYAADAPIAVVLNWASTLKK